MEIQAIMLQPRSRDLNQMSVADLRAQSVDIRKAIETPLWGLVDFHEQQARRELEALNSRAIAPIAEEVKRIHQRLIENCNPVFEALSRFYELQRPVVLTLHK